jgi:hypothetical protein
MTPLSLFEFESDPGGILILYCVVPYNTTRRLLNHFKIRIDINHEKKFNDPHTYDATRKRIRIHPARIATCSLLGGTTFKIFRRVDLKTKLCKIFCGIGHVIITILKSKHTFYKFFFVLKYNIKLHLLTKKKCALGVQRIDVDIR